MTLLENNAVLLANGKMAVDSIAAVLFVSGEKDGSAPRIGWCSPTLTYNTRRSRGGGGSLERARLRSQCAAYVAATMAYVVRNSHVRTIVSRSGTNARAARSAPGGARPSWGFPLPAAQRTDARYEKT